MKRFVEPQKCRFLESLNDVVIKMSKGVFPPDLVKPQQLKTVDYPCSFNSSFIRESLYYKCKYNVINVSQILLFF